MNNQKQLDSLITRADRYKQAIDYDTRINPSSKNRYVQEYHLIVERMVDLARVMDNGRGLN
jgi:hypothetical protein